MLEQLTLIEAGQALGISPDAVRMRVKRGSLQGEKDAEGRWHLWLDKEAETAKHEANRAGEQAREQPNEPGPNTVGADAALLMLEIEHLKEQLAEARGERDYLRRQLDNAIMGQAMAAQAQAQKALASSEGAKPGLLARLWRGFWSD